MSQKIDRYIIGDKIGNGAMGEVFKAYDTQTERDVALKMLLPSALHGQRLERFKLEARTVARLEHPFVVPLYDFSLPDGDEPPFLVMRYMTGGTLADKIRQGNMPSDEVYQITRRIASALDAAHERGLVHRDIKPGNILLDQDGYAYLADFGIVKDTEADESLTQGGQLGTSLYMSPEQIRGEALDHRSDIYALGVVVFEMLAGRPPFTGQMHTIFQGHLNEEIPRIYAFADGVPEEVDDVLRKAMAKKPEDRYGRASHMAKELEAALQSPSAYMRAQSAIVEAAEAIQFQPLLEDDPPSVPDTLPSVTLPETIQTPSMRRWQFLAGGLGLILVVVAVLFGYNLFAQANATPTPAVRTAVVDATETPNSTATRLPPTPIPDVILVLQKDESAIWQNGDSLERLPENGRVPFRDPVLFQAGKEPIELLLPNLVQIFLDSNSSLWVELAADDGEESVLRLDEGRILVRSELPVRIYHDDGYEAELVMGIIGVEFSQTASVWDVDCLSGMCQHATEDEDESIELMDGQSVRLSEGAALTRVDTQLARYVAYNSLDASILLPTLTPTSTPSPSKTPIPTQTPTPSATNPPDFRGPETIVLGKSAGDKDIEVVRFGNGPETLLMVGGIHYGYAPNTVQLAQELIDYFSQNLTAVPDNVTLYIVANLSPDATVSPGTVEGRLNANGVDLNRNWDCRWETSPLVLGQLVEGGGGTAVFSEPEVQLLKTFIEEVEPSATLFWGATRRAPGRVAPGVCDNISGASVPFSQYYGQATGYEFFTNLEVNADDSLAGDVTNWLDQEGIPSIFVILPGYLEIDFQRELNGVLSVLTAVAIPEKIQQTPTPESCQLPVNPAWATVYAEYRFQLGCAESGVNVPLTVWQKFENGRILWREDTDRVYVLYNDATLATFLVDDPALADFRVSDLIKGAVGYVYDSNTAVANKLGAPVDEERQAADVTIQDFNKGFIISWQDSGQQINLILLEANQWQIP